MGIKPWSSIGEGQLTLEMGHYAPAAQRKAENMAYALSKGGKPPMPTKRHGKTRHFLEDGRAEAAKLESSAIQLLYDSAEYAQPISLGIDAGSKTNRHFRDYGERRAVRSRGGAEG
jgi:hypothetical protein